MRKADRKYSIKRKKLVKTTTFVTLLVAATMILSGAVTGITMMMNEKTTMNANTGGESPLGTSGDDRIAPEPSVPETYTNDAMGKEIPYSGLTRTTVVWDNGMSYHGMGSAQDDTQYPLLSEMADDFKFTGNQGVNDVHWIGGYWNGDPAPFDWRIRFYKESGGAPGNLHAGPFIPNYKETAYNQVLKPGDAYACEPFATSGVGKVVNGKHSYIFRFVKQVKKNLGYEQKGYMNKIKDNCKNLPFSPRFLENNHLIPKTKIKRTIDEFIRKKILDHYPLLIERTGAPVAQQEHTIVIDLGGNPIVTTR